MPVIAVIVLCAQASRVYLKLGERDRAMQVALEAGVGLDLTSPFLLPCLLLTLALSRPVARAAAKRVCEIAEGIRVGVGHKFDI